MRLRGDIDKDLFVTGDVLGLYGSQEKDDLFHVKKIVFPQLANQIPRSPILKDR